MKYFISLFLFLFSLCAFAQEPATNSERVKLELINNMTKDGYLSEKMSLEVKSKYINVENLSRSTQKSGVATNQDSNSWTDYLSLVNFIKVLGVFLILFAFWGTIKNIADKIWHLIIKVPDFVYQTVLLGLSVTATIAPHLIWSSQAFYVALLGSIANLIILGWICASYPKIAYYFAKLFNLGIPVASVLSFWGMLYFGALALHYDSQIFGFFAAVCLSGIFSFTLYYSTGTLWLYFKDNALGAVVFGHLVVLGIYSTLHLNNIATSELNIFKAGLEYYCTIALCTGLLVGSAPWNREKTIGLYVLLFTATFVAAILGYFLGDLKVIGSIVTCFFILFCLEWIAYVGFKGGMIIGTGLLGGSLWALSLVLEQHGSFFVLAFLN